MASDGDIIIRHDRRFEVLLGRSMEGKTLSSRLPDQVVDGSTGDEQQRLRRAFLQPLGSRDQQAPVILHSTKLQRLAENRTTICADLLIVVPPVQGMRSVFFM